MLLYDPTFFQITSANQSKNGVSMSKENDATQAAYRRDVTLSEQLVESKEEAAPYSYPKFHIAFCFASCFLSMQLSSWVERCTQLRTISILFFIIISPLKSLGSQRQPTPANATTPQAWVKIVAAWTCSCLYIWTLVAPILFPHRFKSAHVPYMSTN